MRAQGGGNVAWTQEELAVCNGRVNDGHSIEQDAVNPHAFCVFGCEDNQEFELMVRRGLGTSAIAGGGQTCQFVTFDGDDDDEEDDAVEMLGCMQAGYRAAGRRGWTWQVNEGGGSGLERGGRGWREGWTGAWLSDRLDGWVEQVQEVDVEADGKCGKNGTGVTGGQYWELVGWLRVVREDKGSEVDKVAGGGTGGEGGAGGKWETGVVGGNGRTGGANAWGETEGERGGGALMRTGAIVGGLKGGSGGLVRGRRIRGCAAKAGGITEAAGTQQEVRARKQVQQQNDMELCAPVRQQQHVVVLWEFRLQSRCRIRRSSRNVCNICELILGEVEVGLLQGGFSKCGRGGGGAGSGAGQGTACRILHLCDILHPAPQCSGSRSWSFGALITEQVQRQQELELWSPDVGGGCALAHPRCVKGWLSCISSGNAAVMTSGTWGKNGAKQASSACNSSCVAFNGKGVGVSGASAAKYPKTVVQKEKLAPKVEREGHGAGRPSPDRHVKESQPCMVREAPKGAQCTRGATGPEKVKEGDSLGHHHVTKRSRSGLPNGTAAEGTHGALGRKSAVFGRYNLDVKASEVVRDCSYAVPSSDSSLSSCGQVSAHVARMSAEDDVHRPAADASRDEKKVETAKFSHRFSETSASSVPIKKRRIQLVEVTRSPSPPAHVAPQKNARASCTGVPSALVDEKDIENGSGEEGGKPSGQQEHNLQAGEGGMAVRQGHVVCRAEKCKSIVEDGPTSIPSSLCNVSVVADGESSRCERKAGKEGCKNKEGRSEVAEKADVEPSSSWGEQGWCGRGRKRVKRTETGSLAAQEASEKVAEDLRNSVRGDSCLMDRGRDESKSHSEFKVRINMKLLREGKRDTKNGRWRSGEEESRAEEVAMRCSRTVGNDREGQIASAETTESKLAYGEAMTALTVAESSVAAGVEDSPQVGSEGRESGGVLERQSAGHSRLMQSITCAHSEGSRKREGSAERPASGMEDAPAGNRGGLICRRCEGSLSSDYSCKNDLSAKGGTRNESVSSDMAAEIASWERQVVERELPIVKEGCGKETEQEAGESEVEAVDGAGLGAASLRSPRSESVDSLRAESGVHRGQGEGVGDQTARAVNPEIKRGPSATGTGHGLDGAGGAAEEKAGESGANVMEVMDDGAGKAFLLCQRADPHDIHSLELDDDMGDREMIQIMEGERDSGGTSEDFVVGDAEEDGHELLEEEEVMDVLVSDDYVDTIEKVEDVTNAAMETGGEKGNELVAQGGGINCVNAIEEGCGSEAVKLGRSEKRRLGADCTLGDGSDIMVGRDAGSVETNGKGGGSVKECQWELCVEMKNDRGNGIRNGESAEVKTRKREGSMGREDWHAANAEEIKAGRDRVALNPTKGKSWSLDDSDGSAEHGSQVCDESTVSLAETRNDEVTRDREICRESTAATASGEGGESSTKGPDSARIKSTGWDKLPEGFEGRPEEALKLMSASMRRRGGSSGWCATWGGVGRGGIGGAERSAVGLSGLRVGTAGTGGRGGGRGSLRASLMERLDAGTAEGRVEGRARSLHTARIELCDRQIPIPIPREKRLTCLERGPDIVTVSNAIDPSGAVPSSEEFVYYSGEDAERWRSVLPVLGQASKQASSCKQASKEASE
ncbi:hypothetical protein CBR_g49020 [Chara braunii]|uniref:Uncharacterized protein n=1 Tax=Chara braunii TaxID=69332 RepID=A0A388M3Z6_CHABU|nr:hypothetical protein CBR_g49020 [Chara braunii]|eukprot:GBG89310.1 hypothetical protein CBR_g49020 [Chara braunii]